MSEKKDRCFLITPIGFEGTARRRDSDYLLNEVVKPVVEGLGFEVLRGDHSRTLKRIDDDVRKCIEESKFCIVNVTELTNSNVFYELGYADALNKPLLLLSTNPNLELPVDLQGRKYVYVDKQHNDLSKNELKEWMDILIRSGFQPTGFGIEPAKAQPAEEAGEEYAGENDAFKDLYIPEKCSLIDKIRIAVSTGSVEIVDEWIEVLEEFEFEVNKHSFRAKRWDYLRDCVMPAARMGSLKAAELMMKHLSEVLSYKKRVCGRVVSLKERVEYAAVLQAFFVENKAAFEDQRAYADKLKVLYDAMSDYAEYWSFQWNTYLKNKNYTGVDRGIVRESEVPELLGKLEWTAALLSKKRYDEHGDMEYLSWAVGHAVRSVRSPYDVAAYTHAAMWRAALSLLNAARGEEGQEETYVQQALYAWYLLHRTTNEAKIGAERKRILRIILNAAGSECKLKGDTDRENKLRELREELREESAQSVQICLDAMECLGLSSQSAAKFETDWFAGKQEQEQLLQTRIKQRNHAMWFKGFVLFLVLLISAASIALAFVLDKRDAYEARKAYMPTYAVVMTENCPRYVDPSFDAATAGEVLEGDLMYVGGLIPSSEGSRDIKWYWIDSAQEQDAYIPESAARFLLKYTSDYGDNDPRFFVQKDGEWNYPEAEDLWAAYFATVKETILYGSVREDGSVENQLAVIPKGKLLINDDLAFDTEKTVYWKVTYNGLTGYVDQKDLQEIYIVADEDMPIGVWEIS